MDKQRAISDYQSHQMKAIHNLDKNPCLPSNWTPHLIKISLNHINSSQQILRTIAKVKFYLELM